MKEIAGQVKSSASLAHAALGEVDRTGHLMQEPAEAASKVGDAAGLISNIASQTNLLAQSAWIEAARAGEAGLGSAVVAAEAKGPMVQTGRVAADRTDSITGIQGSTDHTAQAIGGIVTRIRDINDATGTVAVAVEVRGAVAREIVRTSALRRAGRTR